MGSPKQKRMGTKRLTVTLAPGQRRVLEEIARHNHVPFAHVVRYAIQEFIRTHSDRQLKLDFPEGPAAIGKTT